MDREHADAERASSGCVSKPLQGLRVLEVGSTMSAPYCAMLLAQLGAAVVKVEPPEGDITRRIGPSRTTGMASLFLALNADKQSVVLDLRSECGRDDLQSLIATSDVVIHNMRPAAARRAGLAPESVRERHASVVLCTIQGYATGSGAEDVPAYDDIIQASSGMLSVQASLGSQPTYVATVLADKTSGMMGAMMILAALRHRDIHGRGTAIEIPMLDVMTGFALIEHLGGETFEPALGPSLYPRITSPNRGPYRTSDGWLSVTIYTPAHWEKFLGHIGRSELLDDPRFRDVAARAENIGALYQIVEGLMPTGTTANWLEVFKRLDIPATAIGDARQMLAERGPGSVTYALEHPSEGTLRYLPLGVRFDGEEPRSSQPPPHLGEHTRDVLKERAEVRSRE
ncbi:CoA transferase [Nocardioides sp. AE5]|uniref:CaiB/BaiF CoA transferase family protein n=1 Tax=Nocardioides sp. AE5 TaxID=2962573 RepID=UPI0028810EE4|nr:CoA transferase [Nocardioides sp. AE5]MDT0203932.1 CoA transferase [Nocardioides sp. AE5]